MSAMMANNQYANRLIVDDTKQYGIWKPAHETATDVAFDNRKLIRIEANSVNSRVDCGAKLVTETGTLSVVI